jgi:hypothetical protein
MQTTNKSRKTYKSPNLFLYGKVSDLTLNHRTGNSRDGGGTSQGRYDRIST